MNGAQGGPGDDPAETSAQCERTPPVGREPPGGHGSYAVQKRALVRRLRRVEGQVRGLQRMVHEERYCVDVLMQIAAARAALDRVAMALLEEHTRGCVTRAIRSDDQDEADAAIRELMGVITRFTKR